MTARLIAVLVLGAALAAADPPAPATAGGLVLRTAVTGTAEPAQPLRATVIAENGGADPVPLHLRWRLQRDPQLIDAGLPDPVDGYDHAKGCASWVEVGGKRSDALLTDADEDSAFSLPWGKGYGELTAFLDLGQVRTPTRIRWKSGDANWIRLVDVAVSIDGTAFTPVPGLSGVDLAKKWGWSDLPWPAGTKARVLRFRAHDNGKPANRICLAGAVAVFDGIANDVAELPDAGETIAQGEADVRVPGGGSLEQAVGGERKLGPGCYLLGLELSAGGRRDLRCERILVAPADAVAPEAAARFGINVSTPGHAASMRRAGFGWVRFENCKWAFFSPEKGKYAFDGSVAPWRVDQDATMGAWKSLGMKVLPYVFVTPEWATSAPATVKNNRAGWPPKDDADYGDAIYQLVAREGRAKPDPASVLSNDRTTGLGIIDAVELWNEPNLNDPGWGPYVGSLSRFYDTFRAGAEAARRADPALPVSGPGWGGIDLALVGSMAEHRYPDGKRPIDFADIVNVHFYSGKADPETCGKDPNAVRGDAVGDEEATGTYWQQIHDLVAWRERIKPAAQIWMTETGNDVGGPIGLTERHQAAKVPRCVMLALASGIDKVFIYRETGSQPSMHAGAGLLRDDASVRPQWYTVATLIRQLQGIDGKALRLAGAREADWLLWWESGQRRVLSAWSLEQGSALGLELGPATVVDAFGASRHVDGTAALPLGCFPCYIRPDATNSATEAAIARARTAEQAAVAQRAKLAATPALLLDFGSRDNVDGYLKLGPPRRYAGVVKDDLWDERRGWGFVTPAADNTDRHWIPSRRDRDACKVADGTRFRFALARGRWTVQVGAESMGGGPLGLQLAGQQQATGGTGNLATFTIDADGGPLELGFAEWGLLRWLVAVPDGRAP